MPDLLLDIHSLSFHYKKTREGIDNINLQLYKGEVVLLLGNNGAGKTTLCKAISGLLKENSGTWVLYVRLLKDNQAYADIPRDDEDSASADLPGRGQ